MKKILLSFACICLLFTLANITIHANNKDTKQILVHIKGADNLYLLNLNNKTMQVKTISSYLYTPISCLDNELSTLKSVDFTSSYTCLLNSIAHTFHTEIDNYVSIDMQKTLHAVGLKDDEYDYQTLESLTKTAKKILHNFKITMIANYTDYIETDLNVKDIYELYQFFSKDDFKTKYYYPNYLVFNQKYYLLDTRFHLKKN